MDVITRVAGTGRQGYAGDTRLATEAEFSATMAVAVTPDGLFIFIADYYNHAVRTVHHGVIGVIHTFAGIGTPGNSGDGGPAIHAELNGPQGLAVTADGGILIADFNNHEVRKVAGGVITRVAGTSTAGNSGDGGRATDAELNRPGAVAVMADGGFLIADTGNNMVRRVLPDGAIITVAGTGTPGHSGDGGPAVIAELNWPNGLAVTADGGFLIADTWNHEVRKVAAG
jgi:serine/threonine-protein kinase